MVILASVCSAQTSDSAAPPTSDSTGDGSTSTSGPSPAASEQAKKATDDANKVEAAVAAAAPLLADADKYQKTIAGITMPVTKSANPALDDLQQLQTTVDAISRSKLIDNLTNKKADLTATESARSTDCSPSQLPPNQQQDVTDAIAKCKKAEKDAKATSDAIDAALSGLQTILATISPYVGDQVTALQATLKR